MTDSDTLDSEGSLASASRCRAGPGPLALHSPVPPSLRLSRCQWTGACSEVASARAPRWRVRAGGRARDLDRDSDSEGGSSESEGLPRRPYWPVARARRRSGHTGTRRTSAGRASPTDLEVRSTVTV